MERFFRNVDLVGPAWLAVVDAGAPERAIGVCSTRRPFVVEVRLSGDDGWS
jgi:hypothetical protein